MSNDWGTRGKGGATIHLAPNASISINSTNTLVFKARGKGGKLNYIPFIACNEKNVSEIKAALDTLLMLTQK